MYENSRRRGISYIQWKEGRQTGFGTSGVGTASQNTILKERKKKKSEVTGRREGRRKQLPDVLKERRGYWKLEEEALDRALCRICFGRSCGPVVRQAAE